MKKPLDIYDVLNPKRVDEYYRADPGFGGYTTAAPFWIIYADGNVVGVVRASEIEMNAWLTKWNDKITEGHKVTAEIVKVSDIRRIEFFKDMTD